MLNSSSPVIRRDLALLAVLTFFLLLPGIFGGYGFDGTVFSHFFAQFDESRVAEELFAYVRFHRRGRPDYVHGYAVQAVLMLKPLYFVMGEKFTVGAVLLTMRLLSAACTVGLVSLTYLIAHLLFEDLLTARFAALFLIATPLTAANGFYGGPGMVSAFWTYLTFYFGLLFLERRHFPYWVLACAATGVAVVTKFCFYLLIPLGLIGYRSRLSRNQWAWGAIGFLIAVLLFNWGFEWSQLLRIVDWLVPDNFATRKHAHWVTLPMFGILAVVGTGLPFCWLAARGIRGLYQKSRWGCLELPLAVYLFCLAFLTAIFSRHLLPFIPYFAIAAGHAACQLWRTPLRYRKLLTAFALFYQLFSTTLVVLRSPYDPRFYAKRWIEQTFSAGHGAFFFAEGREGLGDKWFPQLALARTPETARYLVLTENYYFRLSRSPLTPLTRRPTFEQGFHWTAIDGYLQQVLLRKTNFLPIKTIAFEEWILERWLFRMFFGSYFPWQGNILIFQRTP